MKVSSVALLLLALLSCHQVLAYISVDSHPSDFLNIPSPTQYEYGPSIVIDDGVIYAFYCANSDGNGWDTIRMTQSSDGINWSTPSIMLDPSTAWDAESTCDPSVIKFHGVYYLYHTCISSTAPDGYGNNRICVAMADSITGPYHKFGEPIVQDTTCAPTDTNIYCVGQPASVIVNDTVFLYFTEMNAPNMPGPNSGYVYLATSPNGVNFTWANDRKPVFLQRDVDVKFERQSQSLFMVQGDVGDTHITWSVSKDGVNFIPYNVTNAITTNPSLPAQGSNNNPGIASLPDGSFDGMNFIAYGSSYQAGWGDWHLYRSDILINSLENDCTQCVSTSCDFECSRVLGKTAYGYCARPGSTNPGDCCSCDPAPVPADCSACAKGCVAACNGAGYQTGICASPGSTNPSACCACFN